MSEPTSLDDILNIATSILIRCFVMGLAGLTLWLVTVATVSNWAYNVHRAFIPITRAQFNVVHYTGMVAFKTFIFSIFLLPYIAIKLVQKKRSA